MNRITNRALSLFATLLFAMAVGSAQEPSRVQVTASGIHIGERLTYNISFQRYDNVGFAEIYAVSAGKLGEAEAVELRMKIKTTGLLSAAFYQIDESRTTFANPETGAPLLVRRQDNSSVAPKEAVSNYLTSPSSGLDILALLYKARQTAGSGSFVINEGDRTYSITFQPQLTEHIRTDAGEFETTISNVQSEYLIEHGILSMRINFSADDSHIPVMARFKTAKGEFRVSLSAVQTVEPETEATPVPAPSQTPRPANTPRPTPTPYVDNEPLLSELGFPIGEKLTYRIENGGKPVGNLLLDVKERKFISGQDSLILSATITSAEQGNGILSRADSVVARVNPETLTPFEVTTRLSGALVGLNQTLRFDQRTGTVLTGNDRVDAPVGTHSLLSLLYAVRSFNLTPSKDARNPVNDTRVAVYWSDRAYIFMLRPSEPDTTSVNGQKIMAQRIAVKTNVPQLDQLGITIWLSMDETRTPLLFTIGPYRAELIAQSRNTVK